MNPYEVLGVSTRATDAEIKAAYRKLVKQFHPDKHRDGSAGSEIFQINAAYEILSDPLKRSNYDNRDHYTFEAVFEEDPREVYRREYIRKKNDEAKRARERALAMQKTVFKIVRVINIPILIFGLLLVVDANLPGSIYKEVARHGWQERVGGGGRYSPGILVSFMETEHFSFAVPHEIHLHYDYYGDPAMLTLEVSRIFQVVTNISLEQDGYRYSFKAQRTLYGGSPLHYLMLISAIITAVLRTYSRVSYMLCFMPILLLGFVLLVFL